MADGYNHCILIYSSEGIFKSKFGTFGKENGNFKSPHGIAVTDTEIIVADKDNSRIQYFTLEGKFKKYKNTEENWQFFQPIDIALHPITKEIVVTSLDKIHFITPSGEISRTRIGTQVGTKPGHFINPHGLFIDEKGYYLVADFGNNRVQKLDPSGNYIKEIKGLMNPWGIAQIAEGKIVVSESGGNRLCVIQDFENMKEPATMTTAPMAGGLVGQLMEWSYNFYGFYGENIGEFICPTGITVNRKTGEIFVCDKGNGRLQIIKI